MKAIKVIKYGMVPLLIILLAFTVATAFAVLEVEFLNWFEDDYESKGIKTEGEAITDIISCSLITILLVMLLFWSKILIKEIREDL